MEEENKNQGTQLEEKNEGTGTQPEEKGGKNERTFTQEEVDNMIKDRLKKMPTKEELKEYREWKESQKTEAEKQAEKEAEYNKNLAEGKKAIRENKVLKADVAKEYVSFVAYTVSEQEGDFDENLAKFLKENPKYLQNTETQVIKRTSSSVSMNGKTRTGENETNQIMNDIIRNSRK